MLLCVYYVDDSLTDGVVVLRPTRHKIGHFGDVGQKDDSYIRDEDGAAAWAALAALQPCSS